MKGRIIFDPPEVYHGVSAVSKHYIDLYLKAPAAYHYAQTHPMTSSETDTLLLGSLFHAFALEPDNVDGRYVEKRYSGTTKEGKREAEEAKKKGLTLVKADIWRTANKMAEALAKEEFWQTIMMGDLKPEMSIYWEQDGMPCKARLDGVYSLDGRNYAFDLKSCADASREAVAKAIANFGYHRQSAWYKHAMAMASMPIDAFLFIFVEKTPPYLINVCTVSDNAEMVALEEIKGALAGIKRCTEIDDWPGLCNEINEIDLPRWAYKQYEEAGYAI